MKKYISDYWNEGIKGHANYDFVDIIVNDDNELFIDPILIELACDDWSREANEVIKSFFDNFYEAYRNKNNVRKIELLSHANEQNGTRFGYGRGDNGKGNTMNGLIEVFKPLDKLIDEIRTIKRPEDLTVLMPGFAEDGLSDLLTNIIHEQLAEFTSLQMKKYNIESNGCVKFWTWNKEKSCWHEIEKPSYFIDDRELLVAPKHIVRKKYLFNTDQYFRRVILERIREEGGYMNDGKPIPKSEILKEKRFSGEHWEYKEVISYTENNNDALSEYHKRLPSFYSENGSFMSDEKLDELLYGYNVDK